ncbi:hypothetical protein HC752_09905 [Vibrio sp. S9_S30]|uniref:hypothetical protein n=1 Tax=Vibrio sp. S9_S30 TaxID=2720226 RepID=UPI0016800355|nr:hypothetical protein [Vibrio sp. S9_S30]MBD1557256.1 hypothetical protein [Vibrio sp. S9_S30]
MAKTTNICVHFPEPSSPLLSQDKSTFPALDLSFTSQEERHYRVFAKRYQEVLLHIQSLERRQKRREKNTESLKQTQTLLSFWRQYDATHQKNNTLSDVMISRRTSQYRRLFDALNEGELAKQ